MRPHTRTHCSRKGECEEDARCVPQRQGISRLIVRGGEWGELPDNRPLSLVELPAELLIKIFEYITFKEFAAVRLVSRRLNELCAARLNAIFQKLQNQMLIRFQTVKSQMPRRESARRNHPLARECDIVETLHMRLTLLQMTFGKHIERKHICFFPGEILDEVYRILGYLKLTHPLGRAYKVTDELFDLSTMAMEYFKENIEPNLPEITYFGADFLDFPPTFATPSKKLSLGVGGLDSPISSRASAVGSSCSEPPLTYVGDGDDASTLGMQEAPQSNMVLRKRIRRIRAGMKKYNTQLDEVKRELKTTKSKMDSQSKQVSEYSSRLDEYDKKFEENSRKFGTLLSELNKCKTELQYYRSRSHLMQCLSCGGSINDQITDNPVSDSHQLVDPHINQPMDAQVTFPGGGSVDKQAIVEDWLNPGSPAESTAGDNYLPAAPEVQHTNCPEDTPASAQNKLFKTDEDPYLKSGPGSPGYTRGGPRSPGQARTGKRKSRDEEEEEEKEKKLCKGGANKAIRCKRPKVALV